MVSLEQANQQDMETQVSKKWKKFLLILNCLLLAIGQCGGPMVMRLYFIRGGKRIWFSSFLQTVGFPLILIPLTIAYFSRRKKSSFTPLVFMKFPIFAATAGVGILIGLGNYLYSYGIGKLPVSTSSLITAAQLGFTAVFAFLLVKQKFTAYSINGIALLTVGAGILGLNGSKDRPEKETNKEYVLGFVLMVLSAVLGGLIFPLVELMYLKGKQVVTSTLVLEIQVVLCLFATAVDTVGMLVNHDFQAIPREAREFELGKSKYYMVVIWSAIISDCFFLGFIGVIFCSSSLFSGIVLAVCLPITEVLAVIFYNEKFQATKGVSLALSIWGFISYFYGEIRQSRKEKINAHEQQNGDEESEMSIHMVP